MARWSGPGWPVRVLVVYAHHNPAAFCHAALERVTSGPRAGGPVRRAIAKRWMRDESARQIVEALGRRTPRDIRRHQEKFARAEKGWRQVMDTVLSDWGLKMAGVQETQRVCLYAVEAVDRTARLGYLDLAYRLGRDGLSQPGSAEPATAFVNITAIRGRHVCS
jgi:hypothetical protein